MLSRIELISPDVARGYLARNGMNRKIKPKLVTRYARDMIAGRWQLNGEPVILSSAGELLDGQHRLSAVVESGVPVRMLVVAGVSPDAFKTMNTGDSRNAADVLGIEQVQRPKDVAATATLFWKQVYGDGIHSPTYPTVQERLQVLADNPQIAESTYFAVDVLPNKGRITSISRLAFVHLMAIRAGNQSPASKALASRFCAEVATGEGASRTVVTLRQRLIENIQSNRKLTAPQVIYLILRAWRGVVAGEEITRLQLPRTRFHKHHFEA